MKKTTILMAMMVFLPSIMFAQSFLSEEQELEIKTEKYYWEEGNAFDETMAYHDALNNLTERIISEPLLFLCLHDARSDCRRIFLGRTADNLPVL